MRLGPRIGGGADGGVFAATNAWGERLAVKVLSTSRSRESWQRERSALLQCRHPRVAHLYAAFEHEGRFNLAMQRGGPALSTVAPATPRGRLALCMAVAAPLLQALHFMHRFGFSHGAVRPEHVLVRKAAQGQPGTVHLCGFSSLTKTEGDAALRDVADAAKLLRGALGDTPALRLASVLESGEARSAARLWAQIGAVMPTQAATGRGSSPPSRG